MVEDYAAMRAARVNTFPGWHTGNEPAILAWEIGNEFRCSSCRGTTRFIDTLRELADFLRS